MHQAVHPERAIHRVNAPGVVVVQNAWRYWPSCSLSTVRDASTSARWRWRRWQREIVSEQPAAFLRGLFHSDGCRARNWASRTVAGATKRYHYPRWQFTNESEDIKRWCGEALDALGIAWRQSNRKTLSVSTRAGVRMLDEQIGLKC